MSLLEVSDLRVGFDTEAGLLQAVDGVNFSLDAGQTLGIVGESGCGKSVTSLTLLGLTRDEGTEISGRVSFEGRDLVAADEEELRAIRGSEMAMIFQDPLTSLHPYYKIGWQIVEGIVAHGELSPDEAKKRAIDYLGLVGIPDPSRRFDEYPHEFSGGMRQRAMIAMALVNEPKVLIADEPTTALDVTIQAQILRLLERLQEEMKMAVIMITHDLGVVAEVSDSIMVMYAGRVVEQGTVDEIFYDPRHPYTWGLLGSLARADRARSQRLSQIEGQPPSLVSMPEGCSFRPRCPYAFDKCTRLPGLEARGDEGAHPDRCWLDPERKRELRVIGADDQIGLREMAK